MQARLLGTYGLGGWEIHGDAAGDREREQGRSRARAAGCSFLKSETEHDLLSPIVDPREVAGSCYDVLHQDAPHQDVLRQAAGRRRGNLSMNRR